MLETKDRGRGRAAGMTATPLAYGQSKGLDRIPGAHLLEEVRVSWCAIGGTRLASEAQTCRRSSTGQGRQT